MKLKELLKVLSNGKIKVIYINYLGELELENALHDRANTDTFECYEENYVRDVYASSSKEDVVINILVSRWNNTPF